MKVGHFSFPEAVEELAKRYGRETSFSRTSVTQKKEMGKRESSFRSTGSPQNISTIS